MFIIIFNRDKDASEWCPVGPFTSKDEALAHAKARYRITGSKWIIHPVHPAVLPEMAQGE